MGRTNSQNDASFLQQSQMLLQLCEATEDKHKTIARPAFNIIGSKSEWKLFLFTYDTNPSSAAVFGINFL
jgi:hypothetical protein